MRASVRACTRRQLETVGTYRAIFRWLSRLSWQM